MRAAYERVGSPVFDENGMMKKGIIIRHLLLPSSTNDAIKIIDWVKENCPEVVFSLMAQYVPCGDAGRYKELTRRITEREYEKVCDHLMSRNFEYAYIQDRESGSEQFIPDFNLEGV
jgi:putative pyruvate formate lyase activating enzyme